MLLHRIKRLGLTNPVKAVVLTIVVFLLLGILIRNPLLHYVVKKKTAQISKSQQLVIQLDGLKWKGLIGIACNTITVLDTQQNILLNLQKTTLKPRFFEVILGNLALRSFSTASLYVDKSAFDTWRQRKLMAKDSTQSQNPTKKTSIQDFVKKTLNKLPNSFLADSIWIRENDSISNRDVIAKNFSLNKKVLNGQIWFSRNDTSASYILSGLLSGDALAVNLAASKNIENEYIKNRFSVSISFDSISFELDLNKFYEGDYFQIAYGVKALRLQHPKISSDTLSIQNLTSKINLKIFPESIRADSSSEFIFNELKGNFAFQYPLGKKSKTYCLQVQTPWLDAQKFFSSLPQGAFDDTRDINASGQLNYRLEIALHGDSLDKSYFLSSLRSNNFKIQQFGATRLDKMSRDFVHEVYEYDRLSRAVLVSAENPYFVPFEQVPVYLKNAILTSEDPSFFYHRGFIQEAIRESMIANYKSNSFKRGASTISMQLVKNVFLNRKKTIFRKIEEALIVWLIETKGLTSKEKMFEAYVNLIEWAPGIHGIGEASEFYFNKKAPDLNLKECVFLATIIPKPKKYRYLIDNTGNLKPFMQEQNNFIVSRMLSRGLINELDTLSVNNSLQIMGKAMAVFANQNLTDTLIEEPLSNWLEIEDELE